MPPSPPPIPTSINFNENPEDKMDYLYYEESPDNEMNDYAAYNKTTNSEIPSIDNISKTGTNSKLTLKLYMKKQNHRKCSLKNIDQGLT